MLCVKEIFNLKCLLIEFIISNLSKIYFCIPNIFKTNVYNGFWAQNHFLNLFSHFVNSQKLFCSQKAGVKCSYSLSKLSGIRIFNFRLICFYLSFFPYPLLIPILLNTKSANVGRVIVIVNKEGYSHAKLFRHTALFLDSNYNLPYYIMYILHSMYNTL